jgi:hypothetical protein
MIRFRSVSLALVMSILITPLVAAAQSVGARDADRWHDMAVRLEPAALVSVRLKDGSRLKGTVIDVDDASLALLPKTRIPVEARDIRFEDVASIERTREGLNPGTKVVIGAASVVGGLLMIVAIAFAGWD